MVTPRTRERWEYIAERWGFPILSLTVMVTAMGMGVSWFASNIAQPMVTSHQQFLQNQCEISKQQSETLKEVKEIVGKVSECETKQAETLGAALQTSKANNEMLKSSQEQHAAQIQLLERMSAEHKAGLK